MSEEKTTIIPNTKELSDSELDHVAGGTTPPPAVLHVPVNLQDQLQMKSLKAAMQQSKKHH